MTIQKVIKKIIKILNFVKNKKNEKLCVTQKVIGEIYTLHISFDLLFSIEHFSNRNYN